MSPEPVFADTSFFFALAARRDPAHKLARTVYARLLRAGRRLVTSDYVLDETLTLVKKRLSAVVALALLESVERSAAVDIEEIGALRFKSALTVFRKCADHEFSFTDCTSFALMRELKVREALTTDHHFDQAGFAALLRDGRSM